MKNVHCVRQRIQGALMTVRWLGGAAIWNITGVGVPDAQAPTASPYISPPVTPLLVKVPPTAARRRARGPRPSWADGDGPGRGPSADRAAAAAEPHPRSGDPDRSGRCCSETKGGVASGHGLG
jgi:hypothetical protein